MIFAICTMAVALAATVAVVSCKKEKQDQNTGGNEQVVQGADNMDEYLISFKKKLLSAEKGSETISLEQAERDLGNLLNFDFGDANYATDVYQFDTICLKLATANGEVELSQLAEIYNDVFEAIVTNYPEVDLPEKSVYGICCNVVESLSKDGNYDVVVAVMYRGYSGNSAEEVEGWRPTNKGGTCSGELVGFLGAPEVVQAMLNNNAGEYACASGSRIYFTEVVTSSTDPYHNNLGDPNSPCGRRLYYSTYPYQNQVCLPMSAIMYYYNQARYLKSEREYFGNYPSNHLPLHCYINFTCANYGVPVPKPPYFWRLDVTHGKPNCSGTGTTPEI